MKIRPCFPFVEIDQDVVRLQFGLAIAAAELEQDMGVAIPMPESLDVLNDIFAEGYDDYLKCRDQLRACADEFATGRELPDLPSYFDVLVERYSALVKERPAKVAILCAAIYSKRLGGSDPVDQYYFRQHAPVLEQLNGRMSLTHSVALAWLTNRIMSHAR